MERVFGDIASLSWSDGYALGHASIDGDHEVWFRMIRTFQDAMARGGERSAVFAAIAQAILYTEDHFTREEEAMRAAGYPFYGEHKAMHDAAERELHRFTVACEDADAMADFVASFLPNWVVFHINTSDRRFVDWLGATERDG